MVKDVSMTGSTDGVEWWVERESGAVSVVGFEIEDMSQGR